MKRYAKIISCSTLLLLGATIFASCQNNNNSSSNHEHSYSQVVTLPTCEKDGYTTYSCACGDSYVSDTVAHLGHNWDEGTITKDASCIEEGNTHFTCENDSTHTKDEPIAKTSHSLTKHEESDSTCVTHGNIEYYSCDECGNYFSDSEGKNLISDKTSVSKELSTHHEFSNWKIDSAEFNGTAKVVRECAEDDCNEKEYSTNDIPGIYVSSISNDTELSNLFTVDKGESYTFNFVDGVLVNTNQKVSSSEAKITLTALSAGTLTFDVAVFSESNYDFLTITKGTDNVYSSRVFSKNNEEVTSSISISVAAGDKITISKKADGGTWGNNNGENVDYAKISNISFSSTKAPENLEFVMVSFDTTNGNALNPIVAMKNQPIDYLPTPVREGYVFDNWYIDSSCSTLFDTTKGSQANTTLYAKWISNDAACLARGTYTGYEAYGLKSVSSTVYSINIDILGNITATGDSTKFIGTISGYDEATQQYIWTNGSKTGTFFYNDTLKVIIVEEKDFDSTIGSDFYVFVKNASSDLSIKKAAFSVNDSDHNSYDSQLIEIKSGSTTTLFAVYGNKMYSNITISSILTDASTITIDNITTATDVCVKDASGNVLFTQGYDSNENEMVNADAAYGIYTNGNDTLKIGGIGTLKLNDKEATYTVLENGVVESIIDNVCYHFTLSGNTYTVAIPKATISFVTGEGHNSVDDASYNINIPATLPVLNETGYVFNGWFFDSAFTEKVPDNYIPTADDTLYAKFSLPATLTVVYNNGTTNDEIVYSVGDTVTIDAPTYAKHAFVGWYTTSTFASDTNWTSGSEISEDTTIYAKWVSAPMLGTTYGVVYIEGTNSNGSTGSLTYKNDFTINVDGSSDNKALWPFNYQCSVSDYDYENGTLTVLRGSNQYKAYIDVNTGIMIVSDTQGLSSNMDEIYLLSPFESTYSEEKIDFKSKIKSSYWNKGMTRTISYKASNNTEYTIFVHNNKVYFNVYFLDDTTNATDVTAENCYKASKLYVYDNKLETLIASFGYNGTTMVALDGKEGTYTAADSTTVKLNGINTITLNGVTGTYTLADENEEYTLSAVVDNEYFEITLNGSTCSINKPMVTLTYDANGGTISSTSANVNKNIEITLPTPTRDGYIFKGWEVADVNVNTTYTPTESVTLKAIWNEVFTVILVNNNDTDNVTLSVENNTDVASHKDYVQPTKEGYIFKGWFYDEAFTEAYTGTITEAKTLYANWMVKPEFVGSYKGVEVWGSESSYGNKGNLSQNRSLTISEEFVMSGTKSGTINVSSYDSTTGIMSYDSSNYLMMYIKQNNYEFILINYTSSTTDVISGTDYNIFVKTSSECTGSNDNQFIWNKGSERVFALKVGNETVIIYINANDNIFYGGVSLTDISGQAVECTNTALNATTSLVIKDSSGNTLREFAKDGTQFIGLDGYQGVEYTGSLGTITFDGSSNAVVAGDNGSYVIEDNGNINLTYNNMTKILAVDKTNSTYTTITDGSAGTYTNQDNTFISNGDGTCTYNGTAGTYVISGNNVTYYIGEDNTSISLNNDGTYSTKSVFAGYTFTGSFVEEDWSGDATNTSLKIIFDDTPTISGVLYSGYGTNCWFNFTGEFDGTTLVMTITKAVDNSQVGKTITATLSGNTLTITDTTITNYAYQFDNQGSLTCEDFNL